MAEVMHTSDLSQAESFRVALLAENIAATIEEGAAYSLPTRYVVRVADDHQAAAVTVRTQLEHRALKTSARTLPRQVILLIVIVVGTLFWLLWRSAGR